MHFLQGWGPWLYAVAITILAVLTTNAIADLGERLQAIQEAEDKEKEKDEKEMEMLRSNQVAAAQWTQVR